MVGGLTISWALFRFFAAWRRRAREKPRRLKESQREKLAAKLVELGWDPANVSVRYATKANAVENEAYARDLAGALRRTGRWDGPVHDTLDEADINVTGVNLTVRDPTNPSPGASAISRALTATNIAHGWLRNADMQQQKTMLFVHRRPD